jgi:hypothetical protein
MIASTTLIKIAGTPNLRSIYEYRPFLLIRCVPPAVRFIARDSGAAAVPGCVSKRTDLNRQTT